jgi:YVTN family beta-propeller protein
MPPLRSFVLSAALVLPLRAAEARPDPQPQQDPAPAAAPDAPDAPADRLLVCNRTEDSLSIFLPAERRELATLKTGRTPREVAVSADGATAVVSDYGDQKPGQTLTVVDVFAAKVLRTIDLAAEEVAPNGDKRTQTFLRPHGVRFVAPARVVVTSESARRLLLVDVASGKIERTWTTPQATMHMVAVSPDLRRAAATSIQDGNVVFFGLAADGVASTPPVACDEGSEGLAIEPGTGLVWVGNRAANTVSIVDPTTAKVVQSLPTGEFPFRIAFTPDGAQALVSCAEGGTIAVFDCKRRELVREISIHEDRSELSAKPMGLTTDPAGKLVYVACGRGEFVAVLDLAAGRMIDRLPARKGCDGIAWAHRTAKPAVGSSR